MRARWTRGGRCRSIAAVTALVGTAALIASCAGILGDFTSGPATEGPGSDASTTGPGNDATVPSDAPSAKDSSGSSTDDATSADASATDAQAPSDAGDASTCGPACATLISADGTHTCAVMGDGTVLCWGRNVDGECGSPDAGGTIPTAVPLPGPARLVRSGATSTCALLVDESVWCWGSNALGTIGVPDASTTADGGVGPMQTLPPGSASELLSGSYHACALTTATPPEVLCWGANGYGQAGIGDASVVLSPTPTGITSVLQMSAGPFNSYFYRSVSPAAVAIGRNADGELGRGEDGGIDTLSHPVPSPIDFAPVGPVRTLYRSAGPHMGAVLTTAQVAMWGSNVDGELGPQVDGSAPNPTPSVVPLAEVSWLAMTTNGTCAARVDGSVWCWGTTADGQNGNTVTVTPTQPEPTQVTGVAGATMVTAGFNHVCALLSDGGVECWGFNNFGQLGHATTPPNDFDPTAEPVPF
jgi:alpha-tubulin suppressor-like RCC1 family protein